jgi:RNA-directed DNA polymerase
MIRRLKELRSEMWRRMHQPVRDQQKWLRSVLTGHYAYFGIPGNSSCIAAYLSEVLKAWLSTLRRRGQRPKLPWERFSTVLLRVFPLPPAYIRGWQQPLLT